MTIGQTPLNYMLFCSLSVHYEQVCLCYCKVAIDHFKDVNSNKGVGTLLRMSGPEAFPGSAIFKSQTCQNKMTSTYFLSLAKTEQLRYFQKLRINDQIELSDPLNQTTEVTTFHSER